MTQDTVMRQVFSEEILKRLIEFEATLPVVGPDTRVKDVLARIADTANTILGGHFCAVQPYDQQRDKFLLDEFIAGGAPEAKNFSWTEPRPNGTTRTALKQGILIVEDYDRDVQDHPFLAQGPGAFRGAFHDIADVKAMLGLRLEVASEWLGVLFVNHPTPRVFSDVEIQIAKFFALRAAKAIYDARAYEREQNERRLADTLRDVSAVLTVPRILNATLDEILKQLERVVKYDGALLMLVEGERLVARAARGFEFLDQVLEFALAKSDDIIFQEMAVARSVVLPDVQKVQRWKHVPTVDWVHSWAGVPLVIEEQVIGQIGLYKREIGYYTNEDARIALAFANQAALAIESARQRALAEALRDIAAALSSTVNYEDVLDRIFNNIGRVVQHDAATIMLVEANRVRIVRRRGYTEQGLNAVASTATLGIDEIPNLQQIVETSNPIVIPDTKKSTQWVSRPGTTWVQSYVGAPIRVKGQVIGLLNLDSKTSGFFSNDAAERLQTFADQAGTAIENARTVEQLRVISDIQRRVLAHSLDLDGVIHIILETALGLVGAKIGQVLLLEDDGEHLRISASTGTDEGKALLISDSITGLVIQQRGPILVKDVLGNELYHERYKFYDVESRSELAVPLAVGEDIIGVLNVESPTPGLFTTYHQDLLTALANVTTSAIVTARAAVRELDVIGEVQEMILGESFELKDVFRTITQRALQATGAKSGEVWLRSGEEKLRNAAIVSPLIDSNATVPDLLINDCVIGSAISQKKPVLINDVESDESYKWLYKRMLGPRMRSELAVPLTLGDEAIGALNVESPQVHAFTRHHQDLLATLAAEAAVAIRAAQRHEELVRRRQEQETIAGIQQEILGKAFERDEVFKLILSRGLNLIKATIGQFLAVEENELVVQASTLGTDVGTRVPVHDSVTGVAILSKKPVRVRDVELDEPYCKKYKPILGSGKILHSELAVPLIVGEDVIGSLNVESEAIGVFTEDDERLLQELARQAALALQLAEAFGVVKELSDLQDQILTGHLSLEAASDLILERGRTMIGAETGQVLQLKGEHLVITASTNKGDIDTTVDVNDSVSGEAVIKRGPVNVSDITSDEPYKSKYKQFLGPAMRSEIVVPLRVGGQIVGVLNAESPRVRAFTPHHVNLLTVLAGQAAMAIRVAEQLELQKRASEADKILAAGQIVHRLTGRAGAIRNWVEIINEQRAEKLMEDDLLVESLSDIDRNAAEILDMVRELKASAAEPLRAWDVRHLLETALSKIQVPESIHVAWNVGEDLPRINTKSTMSSVFQNLLTNAVEAMPTGGRLAITARPCEDDKWVDVSIEDTGPGIPSFLLEEIFKASFSGKDGAGRGLGLWWSRTFVNSCGGTLTCVSEEGKGSCFIVKLPTTA